ncbi:hypothetical protein ACJX0J_040188 [Zea mays]
MWRWSTHVYYLMLILIVIKLVANTTRAPLAEGIFCCANIVSAVHHGKTCGFMAQKPRANPHTQMNFVIEGTAGHFRILMLARYVLIYYQDSLGLLVKGYNSLFFKSIVR